MSRFIAHKLICPICMLIVCLTAMATEQKTMTPEETKSALRKLDAAMEAINAMEDNGEIASLRFQTTCTRVTGMAPFCQCLKKSLAIGVTWHEQGWLVYSEMMNSQNYPLKEDFYGQQMTEEARREIFATSVQARNKCVEEIAMKAGGSK